MDFMKWAQERLSGLEGTLRRIPYVRQRIQRETEGMLDALEPSLKPYRNVFPAHLQLPAQGLPPQEILKQLEEMRRREEPRWKDGFASGAVYEGDEEHIQFLNQVYALHSQSNPLHVDLWPSAT